MTAMLEVNDMHAFYGKSHILQGVNFNVGEGEIVSVIGPNGAGKTTLFNLLTGQLRPNEGDVSFKGVEEEDDGSYFVNEAVFADIETSEGENTVSIDGLEI